MDSSNNKIYKILLFSLLVAVTILGIIIISSSSKRSKKYTKNIVYFNIGTGGTTGVYLPAGSSLCRLINTNRKIHRVNCGVQVTGGSLFNTHALASHRSRSIDLAILQSDILYDAYHGLRIFANSINDDRQDYQSLRSVLSLHGEVYTIIVRKSSKIRSINDFKGKRVNIGDLGSGQRKVTDELLKFKKIGKRDIFASELKAADQARALCNNKIDVMIYVAGHPNGATQEASATCKTRILDLSNDKDIDKFLKIRPYYYWVDVPVSKYYQAQEKDTIRSFGVKAVLATNKDVPDRIIEILIDSIFDKNNFLERFITTHQVFNNITSSYMIKDADVIPVHIGAIKKVAKILRNYEKNNDNNELKYDCIISEKNFLAFLNATLKKHSLINKEKKVVTSLIQEFSTKEPVCAPEADLTKLPKVSQIN